MKTKELHIHAYQLIVLLQALAHQQAGKCVVSVPDHWSRVKVLEVTPAVSIDGDTIRHYLKCIVEIPDDVDDDTFFSMSRFVE